MDEVRPLREVFDDLAARPPDDGPDPSALLAGAGHGDLPAELVAQAVADYAISAPLPVAEAVVEFGGAGDTTAVADLLDALASAALVVGDPDADVVDGLTRDAVSDLDRDVLDALDAGRVDPSPPDEPPASPDDATPAAGGAPDTDFGAGGTAGVDDPVADPEDSDGLPVSPAPDHGGAWPVDAWPEEAPDAAATRQALTVDGDASPSHTDADEDG